MAQVKEFDPKSIKLKVGLEVHQQLSTKTKLFCGCPPFVGEGEEQNASQDVSLYKFRRILRPATSELGELDIAARFESRREIKVEYLVTKNTSCLVEADEEPPHPISQEAIDTSLLFSLALNSKIVDEIHVMRKIVVDGSNTSGFQRTAVISLGGKLNFNDGKSSVEVQSIGLEEDAARAVRASENMKSDQRCYALDRLGTPLVEVALAPMEGTPDEVEDAAKTLGRLMRSTGRTSRGLGTIRQDLNISVMNGSVIEVKGIQRLDQISKVVFFESSRQEFFFELGREISEKIGNKLDVSHFEVTQLIKNTKSPVILKALSEQDPVVMCLAVRRFSGFFKRENEFGSRLGKELGAIARTYGLGGVFHSDELPNYGITIEEVQALRENLFLSEEDGFVLLAGSRPKVLRTSDAIEQRIRQSTSGVPPETRAASLRGETTFLRPRPGSARMYPETDIPLIEISAERIDSLKGQVPKPWAELVNAFAKKYDLPEQLASPLFDSDYKETFEKIVPLLKKIAPRFVASVLMDTLQNLQRKGVAVSSIQQQSIIDLFVALDQGRFAKEAVPQVLRILSEDSTLSISDALLRSGLGMMSEEELRRVVEQTIRENGEFLTNRTKESAQAALMGKIMEKVRGKADGKLVSYVLSLELEKHPIKEKINQ